MGCRDALLVCGLMIAGFGCTEEGNDAAQEPKSTSQTEAKSPSGSPPSTPKPAPSPQALPEKARERLAQAQDTDPKVRVRAISELGEMAEDSRPVAEAAVPVLGELLRHDDPATRAVAIGALGNIGDARDYRTRDLQGAGNPLLGSQGVLPALVKTLSDPVEGVREETPRELGKIAEYNLPAARQIIAEVRHLLDSEEPGTRATAAEALAHVANRLGRTWDQLRQAPEPEAARLAEQIPPLFAGVVAPLTKLKDDADAEVRGEAERAFEAVRHFSGTIE